MALNYWMIVKRYPNPNGRVGDLITVYEFFSLLDKKTKNSPRFGRLLSSTTVAKICPFTTSTSFFRI
jgi:hypothetical protein